MEQRVPQTAPPVTIADYLRQEAAAQARHEYHDGRVVAMAGGTADHGLIIGNTIRETGNALKGSDSRVYPSDVKVWINRLRRFYYPDAFVVCGDTQHPPEDPQRTSVTNPVLIIEVLSASTEESNRGYKFSHYALLESLREYVLVSQSEPDVQTFLRNDDGTWRMTFHRGLNAIARLASLGIDLPLSEVYAGVRFPSHPPLP